MTVRSVKSEAHEARQLGAAAVAAALNVGKAGNAGADQAFDAEGKPLSRKPATKVTKGAGKAPTAAAGKGKAGKGGKADRQAESLPAVPLPGLSAVTAVKPKIMGKRDTALGNPDYVGGFNLKRWGCLPGSDTRQAWAVDAPAPSLADILAARALGFGKGQCSGNELSLACCLGLVGRWGSVEAIGHAMMGTTANNGTIKQNVVRRAIGNGLCAYIDPASGAFTGTEKTVFKLPNWFDTRMKACAAVRPTELGLKYIEAALSAAGLEVPDYMKFSNAELQAMSEKAKADKKAARAASKASKQPVAAAKHKVPVKRK